MKIIKNLTTEQQQQIPKTIKKWVDMASTPMNHNKAIEYTRKLYKSMGLESPLIVFGFSPINTILLCELFFRLIKDNPELLKEISQLHSQLSSQLSSQLYSQLHSQLHSQLASQLHSQLYSQLRSQLDSQLDSQLYSQLRSQLDSQLDSQLASQLHSHKDNKISINSNWYLGIFWLIWCGWYEYAKSIGVEFNNDKYDLFVNFNSEVNFIIPYKNICFISEKPLSINWVNNRLHKDGGLAVEYSDGYGMYFLNGVKVPEYLAMTPEGELDIEFFKKENNADVKAEFIRKFGIQRMLSLGEKICDAKDNDNKWYVDSEYEIWNMGKVFNKASAPFLKMKNLTTGIYHFEGIPDNCNTIEDALKFRAKNRNINLQGVA
jgi:hypothetical protein